VNQFIPARNPFLFRVADDTGWNDFDDMFNRWVILVWFACLQVHAQDAQTLPEIDVHLRLNPNVRVYLQAEDDRAGGDPQQFTFGPSIQFSRKPLLRLKHITLFDLDDAKSRPLECESGYRIITAPDTPPEHRAQESVTFRIPLLVGLLVSDRNRADLDWQNGIFTWRYRNQLRLERTVSIHSYHFIPYLEAEPFYESKYSKWSATDLYVGSLFPVGKHVQFDSYFEYENDTSKKPNRQNHYAGLALHIYFSLKDNNQGGPS
jgi:hypothetical protein